MEGRNTLCYTAILLMLIGDSSFTLLQKIYSKQTLIDVKELEFQGTRDTEIMTCSTGPYYKKRELILSIGV